MKYGKLVNGAIQYAPKKVHVGRHWIYNPKPEILMEMGYKPVQDATYPGQPENGYYWRKVWTESENAIFGSWELEPIESE